MKRLDLWLFSLLSLAAGPVAALVDPEVTQQMVPGWMADIHVVLKRQNRTTEFCKGVLIAPQWVLSAASCEFDPGRVREDEQGEPEYIVKLGPNADVVEVEEFYPSDDYSVALLRIALPSEATPLPLTGKTAAELLGQEAVIFGRQSSLPVMHAFYNPAVTAPSALCQVNGKDFSIDGAFCYLLTRKTNANTLFRTRARIIDPLATTAPATALDKLVKPDSTGYLMYLDFRDNRSYPCHEDIGAPVLVQNGNSYEIAAVVTGVGMTASVPICGMSLANEFVSIDGAREFIEQTMAGYDFEASCPIAPEPEVTYTGNNGITLKWDAVKGATGYKVHYTGDHGHVPISTVDVKGRTDVATVIAPGVEYLVAVTAYNANCSSELSDPLPVNLGDKDD